MELSEEAIILIGVLVGAGVPVAGTAIFLGVYFGLKQKKAKKEKQKLKKELEKQKANYTDMPDVSPNKETPYMAIGPNKGNLNFTVLFKDFNVVSR